MSIFNSKIFSGVIAPNPIKKTKEGEGMVKGCIMAVGGWMPLTVNTLQRPINHKAR